MDITINHVVTLSPHLQDLLTRLLPHIVIDGMALPVREAAPGHRVDTTTPLPPTEAPKPKRRSKAVIPSDAPTHTQSTTVSAAPPVVAQAPQSVAPAAAPLSPVIPIATAKPAAPAGPTIDDVGRLVSAAIPRIGMDALRDLFKKFGVAQVVKLAPEHYAPFCTALQAAMQALATPATAKAT